MTTNLDAGLKQDGIEVRTQAEAPEGQQLHLSDKSRAKLVARLAEKGNATQRVIITAFLDKYYTTPDRRQECEKCDQKMTIRYLHDEGGWIAPRPVNAGTIRPDNMVAFVACECGEDGFIFRFND
jgi:hypothetical protein